MTAIRKNVIQITSDVLGIPASLLDNSRDLGALDSLDMLEVGGEIEMYYDIALNNDSLLECKDIDDLVRLVESVLNT